MTDAPFHATRMGQRFYEHTAPELVRQLTRLNENLERLIDRSAGHPAPSQAPQEDPSGPGSRPEASAAHPPHP